MQNQHILQQAADQARGLAIDAIHACSSGHLGLPLGAAEIGSLLALPLLIRLVANPLVSALADRYLRPGQAIALLSAVACAGFGALFLVSGFWPTALVLAATSLAWGPLVPISDALAARVQDKAPGLAARLRRV